MHVRMQRRPRFDATHTPVAPQSPVAAHEYVQYPMGQPAAASWHTPSAPQSALAAHGIPGITRRRGFSTAQVLATHVSPGWHTFPQRPQLRGSRNTSAHSAPHRRRGGSQPPSARGVVSTVGGASGGGVSGGGGRALSARTSTETSGALPSGSSVMGVDEQPKAPRSTTAEARGAMGVLRTTGYAPWWDSRAASSMSPWASRPR